MQSTLIVWKGLAAALMSGALASSACYAEMGSTPVIAPDRDGPVQLAAASSTAAGQAGPAAAVFPATRPACVPRPQRAPTSSAGTSSARA
jgi:hypothetical protein